MLVQSPEVIKLDPARIDAPTNVDITWTRPRRQVRSPLNVDIEMRTFRQCDYGTETNVALGGRKLDLGRHPIRGGARGSTQQRRASTYSLLANCRERHDQVCSRAMGQVRVRKCL